MNEYLEELQNIYKPVQGLRNNNGSIEFALDSTYGLQWFPINRLPERAEKFLIWSMTLESCNECKNEKVACVCMD